ncbi:MAG: hypothetical protein LBV20_02720 [Treponema sp.]|jgi:fermentation-respiration switch protein FrsA (DUF1100 family)|nr:hypothetical protein [Treponema sp.]
MKKVGNLIILILALVMMIGGSILAYLVNTNFGKVAVSEIRIHGDSGFVLSAYLYTPKDIEPGKTAPAILSAHGMNNGKQHMANTSLELARRGFIVLNMDQVGHGDSTGSNGAGNYGGPDGLAYLRSLPNVDKNNIGLVGMSQGGFGVVSSAVRAFPDGHTSAFYMESEYTNPGSMDMSGSENLKNAAFNWGLVSELNVMIFTDTGSQAPVSPVYQPIFGTTDPIVPNRIYGSIEDGTARILYQPFENHNLSTDAPMAIGNAIDWMQQTLQGEAELDPQDQIWGWKLFGTIAAFFGALLFVFPFGYLLLQTKLFKPLVMEVPEYKGFKKGPWWVGAIFTTAIGPLILGWTWIRSSAFGNGFFPPSTLWPLGMVNPMALWNIFLGIITIVFLGINFIVYGKKNGISLYHHGVTEKNGGIAWDKVGKSFIFAVCVILPIYLIVLYFAKARLIDFRLFFIAAFSPLNLNRWFCMFTYFFPYVFYFIPAAMVLASYLRYKDGKASLGAEMLMSALMLTVGLVIWFILFYAPILAGGTVPWVTGVFKITPLAMGALNAMPMVFCLPFIGCALTYFYRKTGRIYTGIFIVTLIMVWMNVGWGMFTVEM